MEACELELNAMRQQQSRLLETSETDIHKLDTAMVQQRALQLGERDQLLREISDMSDKVLEHKMHVTQVLRDVLEGVAANRKSLARAGDSTTPKKGAVTPLVRKQRLEL